MNDSKKPREFWILDKWFTFPNRPELVCYNEKPHPVYISKGANLYHVIEKEAYLEALAQAEKLEKALFSIKKHTLHPDNKPSVWNDYLQDLADEALAEFKKWKDGK